MLMHRVGENNYWYQLPSINHQGLMLPIIPSSMSTGRDTRGFLHNVLATSMHLRMHV